MNDFHSWKRNSITQVIMAEFKARIEQLTLELVEQATTGDPRILAEKSGAIKAYRDVLDIQVEEAHED